MGEHVIAIDFDRCTGCRLCETMCSMISAGESNPEKARIRIVKIYDYGQMTPMPVVCMNCVRPFCQAVCPMKAIYKNESSGVLSIDEEKCIGCSSCAYACPFGAIAVDRSKGSAFKCNQCDGDPVCVTVCPTNAIEYLAGEEVSLRMRRAGLQKYETFISGHKQ